MNKRQAIMKMITDNPHLSVSELSKRTGLSRTVFYKWKAGDFDNIQIKSVQAVADATGTNIKIDGDNIEIVNDIIIEKENDMNVEASYIIELQKEKIERLESQLRSPSYSVKPAYHFKIVGKYIQKTDTWRSAKIYGDISMLGFSYDELNDILSIEGNNPNSFIDRYHPDSYEKLHESEYWKKTKSDCHHCTWNHMMWKSKSGQYLCFNIDMIYNKKEETVTTLFYYVNDDKE